MSEPVTAWVRVTGHLPGGLRPGLYLEVDLQSRYVQDAIGSGFMVLLPPTDVGSETDEATFDKHEEEGPVEGGDNPLPA